MGGWTITRPVGDNLSVIVVEYLFPLITYTLVITNVVTYLLYHKQLRSTVTSLWDIYRTLECQAQVLKILALLVTALYWPMPLIYLVSGQLFHGTLMLLLFTDFQMCLFAFLMEDAFRALKVKVKELYKLLVELSEVGGFLLYFDEPCTKLGNRSAVDLFRLRQIHRQLHKVMTTVNRAYNVAALVVITIKRFFFTMCIYSWISSSFHSHGLTYSLFYLYWILYLCYRFEALQTVENESINMINIFDKRVLDIKTRAEFKLFFIQLGSLQMVISPIQMFNLDFTLITSMFTSTITYLMLLQQFN